MAKGQPAGQPPMNPYICYDDDNNFSFPDNKQMPYGEVSAAEHQSADTIPNTSLDRDPRQAAITTSSINTPTDHSPAWPTPHSASLWSSHLVPDTQFQQRYSLDQFRLLHNNAGQATPFLGPYSQQPQQPQYQQQHLPNTAAADFHNQYHPQQLAQTQISSRGYTTFPQTVGPVLHDQLPYAQSLHQHQRSPSTTTIPAPVPRRPKSQHNGRKSFSKGILHDKTNHVQKPEGSSLADRRNHLRLVEVPPEYEDKFNTFLIKKGTVHEEHSIEVSFQELEKFFTANSINVKDEPMSRGHSVIEHIVQGPASVRHGSTAILSPNRLSPNQLTPNQIEAGWRHIVKLYSGYQKEFRPKESSIEAKFKCTLGCSWSHKVKSNWERHEKTHYPQEIWICCHEDCLSKGPRTRVSFRKDLARRHHIDHHQREGDTELTDMQLEQLKVKLTESLFPRVCVFQRCQKQFTSFEERSAHMERHLKDQDDLNRGAIVKFYAKLDDGSIPRGPDSGTSAQFHDDNDDDDNANDDDDEDNNDQDPDVGGAGIRRFPGDREDGTGGSGGGSGLGPYYTGAGGSNIAPNSGYSQQGYPPTNTPGYYNACSFDTFGGSGNIPIIDKRPWKTATSLRLQLLPQVFARGIAQTPLVLKKIQLQAALMLDLSSTKKTQIVNILRREIAMMAGALPVSSGPSIKRFPPLTSMTKLLPGLTKTASRFDMSRIAKQNQAILKFAGLRKDVLSEEMEDPGGGDDDDEEVTDPLHDRLMHFTGGHIYQCLPVRSPMTPITPCRLVHIGTKNKPILHLDTSEVLPSRVNYCSLTHCWDDGYGLCLSKGNVTSLRHSIPADGLTQTFHVAINMARERGIEYLWIDTLCIIQDSDEDIEAHVPRITQIHASAVFAITITSVSYDGDAQQFDEFIPGDTADFDEKSELRSMLDTPGLTLGGDTIETEISGAVQKGKQAIDIVQQVPVRRDSHQLETFLAEGSKRSFFSPLLAWDKISRPRSSSSAPSHLTFDYDKPVDDLDGLSLNKQPSRVVHYLDKWRFRWQKLSSTPPAAPMSSTTSTATSPAPSISDKSTHSERKRLSMFAMPAVSFEKLFRGFRSRHTHESDVEHDSSESDE